MIYSYDIAIEPGVTLSEVETAIGKLGGVFAQEIPATDKQLFERIWRLPDDAVVRYVYDRYVDVATIRAETPHLAQPARIVESVSAVLPLTDRIELNNRARGKDPTDRRFAIRAYAALANEYDADLVSALNEALTDQDAGVRDDAIRAIRRWPHFVFAARLDKVAATEPDPDRAHVMTELAENVRLHGRRGL
ncbi:MAG: hypothetical protein ACKV2T_00810 [Kofleriaceae bacterium]